MRMHPKFVWGFVGTLVLSTAAYIFVSNYKAVPPAPQSIELRSLAEEDYEQKIRPIFENRCTVCHSCYNGPCQLNLTSYEGFARGATKKLFYEPQRLQAAEPTRLYTDAQSVDEWRKKGFHSVHVTGSGRSYTDSTLWQMVAQRAVNQDLPKVRAEDSHTCTADSAETRAFLSQRPDAGMPYGLPPLNELQLEALAKWLSGGALGPQDETDVRNYLEPERLATIRQWEEFLNASDLKTRVVSRYLYEHLFLAHFQFKEIPREFFRLVRSRTACEAGVEEIATRRPFDDPGVANFRYCFRRLPGTPVEKSHILYTVDNKKMDRFRELFFQRNWEPTRFPSWDPKEAANPFVSFQEVPGRARYQFLLDDAQYHVMTFIKGPVCKGNTAVNSIDEQFLVLFLDPDSDPYSNDREFARQTSEFNQLPAQLGSDLGTSLSDFESLLQTRVIKNRNRYREYRDAHYAKVRPKGYSLEDIWDGDGSNRNSLLTVLRHYDSAAVLQGAVGDVSKTVFVLDYVLFERLSYDLVSGFDVSGNVGHQLLTRMYMAFIRMEAEELFLSFLPSSSRKSLRDSWYRGAFTKAKMWTLYPLLGLERPTQVRFSNPGEAKYEFLDQVFSTRLSEQARGPLDPINWRADRTPARTITANEAKLRSLVSKPATLAPYVLHLPDLSFLRVRKAGDGRQDEVYSIVRNRERTSVAWINAEDKRLEPEKDTIYITKGFAGSFPNKFYVVDEAKLSNFVAEIQKVKSVESAQEFNAKWAISRNNPDFWSHSDWFNWKSRDLLGPAGGLYDLNRYEMPVSLTDAE